MALRKVKVASHPSTNLYLKVSAKVSEAVSLCTTIGEFCNYLNTDLNQMKTGNHAKVDNYYEVQRHLITADIWKLDAKATRTKILWIVREE